jgi:CRP/FNR family transcriptional regulator
MENELEKNLPGLSDRLMDQLKEIGTTKVVKKGETLLQQDAPVYNIPIVLDGAVNVTQMEDDKEILLYYLKRGDMCIMSFLGGFHNEKSKIKAVAGDDSKVLMIPVNRVGMLLKSKPEWTDYIFAVYHKRFNELLDVVGAVAFKKMDERLLSFLKRKAEITDSNELEITHEEIARELGTARVVVSRLLKELEKKDVVILGRNRVTLV